MHPQYVLLTFITACAAVPLNINLGAYSPALVVGDGEISLGSEKGASELMATLASGANEAGRQGQQGQQAPPREQAQPPQEGQAQRQGEAPAPAEPKTETPPAAAKRAPNLVRTLESLNKRAEAEAADAQIAAIENAFNWIKRDLQGFNAALTYAREAMKNTPKIELGTPKSGVGILQNAGLNVPANSAANGAGPKAKRSEAVEEESEAPKMTLVAITEV